MRKTILIMAVLAIAIPLCGQQAQAPQIQMPRLSPKSSVMQTVGLTDVTITYSRPSVKGRQIWGALVPYDKVWRTGANEATTISVSDDVTVNGQALPKGTYSLHTIPGKDQWTIIFNNVANQWGSFNYDATKDALRVTAKPEKAPFTETMTFEVPSVSADQATVVLRWENLAVPLTIGTDTTRKVLASARAAVAAAKPDDWRTPYRAASYAYDNRVALDEASKWLEQSLKINQNINNLFLKARAQAAAGNRAAAVATAREAIAKATDKDKEEVEEIEKSMASWKS